MMNLEESFEDLMRKAYPSVLLNSVQYRESKMLFFAGAAAVFYYSTNQLTALPDEQAEAEMQKIQDQIRSFFGR